MKTSRLLTEQECKKRLYKILMDKQKDSQGELPAGKLSILIESRLRFFNGKPWKRQLLFSVGKTDYSAEVNPYTGDIISVFKGHIDPKKASDLVYITSPKTITKKRSKQFRGSK